ncbi:hypothetical protein D4764_11G0003050 [Takifugu flavidus]|uniref:Uncharacterized protein n=1 Tax=Takifugu flavidus TaxID=433684 RepID=A0A5C6PEG8_9TELE|nr:hypothetical protein D4764_11G0003050 [Takifugu flavidus]
MLVETGITVNRHFVQITPLMQQAVHRVLSNKADEFNYRFIVRMDNFNYTLFTTSSALKCFSRGDEGHLARVCPSHPGPLESVVQCGGRPRCLGFSRDGVTDGGEME